MFYLTPSMVDGIQNVSEDIDVALLADYLENFHPYYDCKQINGFFLELWYGTHQYNSPSAILD